MVAPLGLSPCPPTHLHQGLVPLMFKEAHSLINEGPTSLVPVVGDDWWVLLCGNVGTWIFGAGAGGDVVSHWHLPILSDNGDPQEAPVSLLESWGIL